MSNGPKFWRVSVFAGLLRGWCIRWAHWRTLDDAQRYLDRAAMSDRWVREMDVKPWRNR